MLFDGVDTLSKDSDVNRSNSLFVLRLDKEEKDHECNYSRDGVDPVHDVELPIEKIFCNECAECREYHAEHGASGKQSTVMRGHFLFITHCFQTLVQHRLFGSGETRESGRHEKENSREHPESRRNKSSEHGCEQEDCSKKNRSFASDAICKIAGWDLGHERRKRPNNAERENILNRHAAMHVEQNNDGREGFCFKKRPTPKEKSRITKHFALMIHRTSDGKERDGISQEMGVEVNHFFVILSDLLAIESKDLA